MDSLLEYNLLQRHKIVYNNYGHNPKTIIIFNYCLKVKFCQDHINREMYLSIHRLKFSSRWELR